MFFCAFLFKREPTMLPETIYTYSLGRLRRPQTPPFKSAWKPPNYLLKINSTNFRTFLNWWHFSEGLARLIIFRHFLIWWQPRAQNHTSEASWRGEILVQVSQVWIFSENFQTGGWLTDSTPVQNLPPGYSGPKSQITVLKVHNSIFEPVTLDDTEIFHAFSAWSTL